MSESAAPDIVAQVALTLLILRDTKRDLTMPEFDTLNVSRDGAVARVAFNRPASLNAMNGQMRRELFAAARELNLDESIRVVILTGEGRAFGAGADDWGLEID